MAEIHAPIAKALLADRRLYKFRSIGDETKKSRLRDIILNHRIRFARPSQLNDPLEGTSIYQLGDWSSEVYRDRFAQWAWNGQRHLNGLPPQDKFRAWILSRPREVHEQHIAGINATNHEAIEVKWRVLSLSGTATQELMWSHYADGHSGVALVFDASHGEFALAYRVDYVRERVPLDITSQDLNEVLRATLLSKRAAWAYELEDRCIAPEPWEPDTLRLEAQHLRFMPAQLLGVIFGAKASPQDEAEITAWAARRENALSFWKALICEAGNVEVRQHAP